MVRQSHIEGEVENGATLCYQSQVSDHPRRREVWSKSREIQRERLRWGENKQTRKKKTLRKKDDGVHGVIEWYRDGVYL